MKTHCLFSLLASAALWLAPSPGGLHAQNPAPSPPKPPQNEAPKPPGDPFVKGKPTPGKPPAVPEAPPRHLVFTFETYKLPQSALDALHEEGLAPQPFFDKVRQMVASKQASLESLMVMPTRSGQRATVESVDELIYPTEFDPAVPGRPFHFPTAYEMRPLGERIELDPVEGPDGTIDINASLSFTRLAGFTAAKADPNADGEVLPTIASRVINSSMSCRIGVPTLMGTTSAPTGTGATGADGDGSVSITFVRCGHSSPVPPSDAPAVVHKEGDAPKNIRVVFRFYSLPREKARDLLAETLDADLLLQKTTSLPKDEVKLERLVTLITRSGQRCLTGENGEWMYGTEMHPSKPPQVEAQAAKSEGAAEPKDPQTRPAPSQPVFQKGAPLLPAGFSRFETRTTGWRIEIDPVLSNKGDIADLNLAPELVEYRGIVQGHPLLARYPEQPLFSTQKVTTAVTSVVGRQCFLGTMSRPHDTGANGRQDDGRTWFAFVKVTVE